MRYETRAHRPGRLRLLTLTLALVALGGLAGCAKKKTTAPLDQPPSPRLKPADVVEALQWAYRHRDAAVYARLLASDFQFWFDPSTRPSNVPDFWTRPPDSTATAYMFAAIDISDIRIHLIYGADTPVSEVGKERWRTIRVTDTFLEVDKVPPTGEVVTFRVDGDVQDFYVRKGFTPGDTLTTSPTAREWFLVEWHDLARLAASARVTPSGGRPATDQSTTWSNIKTLYGR